MTVNAEVRFPADQVISALYQGILRRAPDKDGLSFHTRWLEEGGDLEDIVRAFVASPEARDNRVVSLGILDGLPPNQIQFDLSADEREILWRHVSRVWSRFGEDDPYYSVLTSDDFRIQNLSEERKERFYASGEQDVLRAEKYLARHGLQLPQDGCCVDYGCGVGRITLWLARRCKRVVAVDVSEAHLRIAREALAARGVTNVEFHLLRRRGDLSRLRGIDFFHSVLVLQHNPPPIIAEILEQALGGLNNGGSAFFQVPTYGTDYRWQFDQYIVERSPHTEIEMHVVPQSLVFAAASRGGCLPMEIQPDALTGIPHWISNTFLFAKANNPAALRRHATGSGGIHAGQLLHRLARWSTRQRAGSA